MIIIRAHAPRQWAAATLDGARGQFGARRLARRPPIDNEAANQRTGNLGAPIASGAVGGRYLAR